MNTVPSRDSFQGNHLSWRGLSRVSDIFSLFRAGLKFLPRNLDWKTFDEVYAGVYAINLSKRKRASAPSGRVVHSGQKFSRLFSVSAHLPLSLPDTAGSRKLRDSLIDDEAVLQIAELAAGIGSLLPLPTRIQGINLTQGRVAVTAYCPTDEFRKAIKGGLPLDERDFGNKHWQKLRRRLGVTRFTMMRFDKA